MGFKGLSFSHLRPTGTVKYTLSDVFVRCDKPLVLELEHAGDANKRYTAQKRKLDAKFSAATKHPGGADWVDALIPIFANTVVVGWENCLDENGQPEQCTPAQVTELLQEIAANSHEYVATLMSFAMKEANFRDAPASPEVVGKK